ncbi:hypothetical protein F8388_009938 [Cannabis sativa]|uniref:Single-stranded DNA-binding protein, mitochondrial n=1 Tax=Cannabis sativa TaxID=3483 RepID=A0A7J6ELP3_CANSA|nr:hypothetical protein G4B88_024229 [Cannabis sativa]KAF4389805.1 hypothetical protein F8388_009938 [Cannabis sativa]
MFSKPDYPYPRPMFSKTLHVPQPRLGPPFSPFSHSAILSGFLLKMSAFAGRLTKYLRISAPTTHGSSFAAGAQRCSKLWFSTESSDQNEGEKKNVVVEEYNDDLLGDRSEAAMQPQGVNPGKGWLYRGVHKAIICGKVGQAPVQKILRNGRTITIFTVGTGGMFDQRTSLEKGLPRPAQWHRIAVHNDPLGTYAVQKIVKNSPVYVEGDIETRVYNDSINGEVKYIAEICVRQDGRIRLIKTGESVSNISLDDLREGLF